MPVYSMTAPTAAAQPSAPAQRANANVLLTSAIEGIDAVRSAIVRATLIQAAIEVLNCEPRNGQIGASAVVADGSVCLRVRGLATIVAKQLDHRQWSLTPAQADCVRSAEFDAKAELLAIALTDASKQTTAEQADAWDADVASASDSEVQAPSDGGAAAASSLPQQQSAQSQQRRPGAQPPPPPPPPLVLPPRKPIYSVTGSMKKQRGPAAAAAAATTTTTADGSRDQAATGTATATRCQDSLEVRKTYLPAVADAVTRMADAVALLSEALTWRADMYNSRRYCSVSVAGLAKFDWRLLSPAVAWPHLIPSYCLSKLIAQFDVAKKELVVRIAPYDQVDRIYKAIAAAATKKCRDGDAEGSDTDSSSPSSSDDGDGRRRSRRHRRRRGDADLPAAPARKRPRT